MTEDRPEIPPLLIPLRRTAMLMIGAMASLCGLICAAMVLRYWRMGLPQDNMVLLIVLLGLFGLGYGIHCFGVAHRRPVALRMDADGISGYYADPAEWKEVMKIDVFSDGKGRNCYLGFAFLNPDIIGARQSFFRKFVTWARDPQARYQIVIPAHVLQYDDIHSLAGRAELFRRAA